MTKAYVGEYASKDDRIAELERLKYEVMALRSRIIQLEEQLRNSSSERIVQLNESYLNAQRRHDQDI